MCDIIIEKMGSLKLWIPMHLWNQYQKQKLQAHHNMAAEMILKGSHNLGVQKAEILHELVKIQKGRKCLIEYMVFLETIVETILTIFCALSYFYQPGFPFNSTKVLVNC